jgi:hypothetical protein
VSKGIGRQPKKTSYKIVLVLVFRDTVSAFLVGDYLKTFCSCQFQILEVTLVRENGLD